MTRTEFKNKMLQKKDGTRVLAIFNEKLDDLNWICSGNIEEIAAVELYFNFGMLRDEETLYHFLLKDGEIFTRDSNNTNGGWFELNA